MPSKRIDTYVRNKKVLVERTAVSMVKVLKFSELETDAPIVLKLRTVETDKVVKELRIISTPSAVLAERTGVLEVTMVMGDRGTPVKKGETTMRDTGALTLSAEKDVVADAPEHSVVTVNSS